MFNRIFPFLFLLLLPSCFFSDITIRGKDGIKLRQVDFNTISGWEDDYQNRALISFSNSCNKFATMSENKKIGKEVGDIIVADFHDVCDIADIIKSMSAKQARNFFENWFVPFEISNNRGQSKGLFTGYFIPELRGSRTKTEIYQHPIYAKPKNPRSYSHLTREDIENGSLRNKDLELVWVDDKVDLFFMHVQGSGRVILDDGSIMRLGYAGKNNKLYSSIGKFIIKNNIIDGDVSYFSIKNWLKNNPKEAEEIMNVNESYVFFRESEDDYVIGSQGVPLMANRSLAVDTGIIPLGFPMWLDIKTAENPYQKLVITQDTGSAIKGTIRGDIFFGRGKEAEMLAATMNYKGKYYILLPTAAVDRIMGR